RAKKYRPEPGPVRYRALSAGVL
ncbi:vgrG protein, partial [Escherichia coli EC1869]